MGNGCTGENIFKCRVKYVNNGPFTTAIYLESVEEKSYDKIKTLRWEISREKWQKIKNLNQPWDMCIDSKKLFLIWI